MIWYNLENHLHWISLLTLKSNKGHIVWPQAVSRSTKNSENMFFKYNQTDSFSLLLKDGSFDPIQRWRSHLSFSIRPHFPTPFQLNLKRLLDSNYLLNFIFQAMLGSVGTEPKKKKILNLGFQCAKTLLHFATPMIILSLVGFVAFFARWDKNRKMT